MTKKYVVKNCPNMETNEYYLRGKLITERICTSDREELRLCQNCTDCVIKQVVEKCKNIECPCELEGVDCLECGENRRKTFAQEILQLFEIEEVE